MNVANTTPTASDATAVRMIDATIAPCRCVISHGTSGMNAPRANETNEDAAACTGDPRFLGLIPSSSRACVSSANSGSAMTSCTMSRATAGSMPLSSYMPTKFLRFALGALTEGLSFHIELALEELALGRHREVLPRPHREGAGDQTCHPDQPNDLAPGLAPATPSTSEMLVTRPSLSPKTAALAPPPRTSRCWWNCSGSSTCTSVVIPRHPRWVG